MTVYLLHFESPLGNENHQAQHYIGYANQLLARLDHHKTNPDARIMQVVKERGIGWALAETWDGDKGKEREIKNKKCGPKLCPICRGVKPYEQY